MVTVCWMRGTGSNQDQYSNGIAVSSSGARRTSGPPSPRYARARLSPASFDNGPELFGAQSVDKDRVDPEEAAAFAQCFEDST